MLNYPKRPNGAKRSSRFQAKNPQKGGDIPELDTFSSALAKTPPLMRVPKKWITAFEKVGKLTAGEPMGGERAEHTLAF